MSLDVARSLFKSDEAILNLIDTKLNKYYERSKPLESPGNTISQHTSEASKSNDPLRDEPLVIHNTNSNSHKPAKSTEKNLLRDEPLAINYEKPLKHTPINPKEMDLLRNEPLVCIDERKFEEIYDKYNDKISTIFPGDRPSLLDVDKSKQIEKNTNER